MLYKNPNLTSVSFIDPYLSIEWTMKGSNMMVRGTPGAGDFMFTMCSAIYAANLLKTKINIIFYWDHDLEYEHNFEDPESIYQKLDWFYSRLYNNHLITYEHVTNFDLKKTFDGNMMLNLEQTAANKHSKNMPKGVSSWKFKKHLYDIEVFPKKVTVWRFKFNSAPPSSWKTEYDDAYWDNICETLISKGYDVHIIDYRTPIREAFYHIQTSRFVMGYDGMWHYLARMLYKPTIITGSNSIVKMHNPQAIFFHSPKTDTLQNNTLQQFINNIDVKLPELDDRCRAYKNKVDHIIENR